MYNKKFSIGERVYFSQRICARNGNFLDYKKSIGIVVAVDNSGIYYTVKPDTELGYGGHHAFDNFIEYLTNDVKEKVKKIWDNVNNRKEYLVKVDRDEIRRESSFVDNERHFESYEIVKFGDLKQSPLSCGGYDWNRYSCYSITVVHCSGCNRPVWIRGGFTRSGLVGSLYGHEMVQQSCICNEPISDDDECVIASGPSTCFGYGAEIWVSRKFKRSNES